MSSFLDVFFGTPQSLYASYAILAAIITICITILLTGTEIPLANRFLFIFLTILMLIPSVFLILFQITCMVTGGNKNNKWWCWLYAWIVSIFIIIYCIFVIIIAFSSLFTYSNAVNKLDMQDATSKVSPEVSNAYAQKVMLEHFANESKDNSNTKKNNQLNQDHLINQNNTPSIPSTLTPPIISETTSAPTLPLTPKNTSVPATQTSSLPQTTSEIMQRFNGNLQYDETFSNGGGIEAFTNDDKYSSF